MVLGYTIRRRKEVIHIFREIRELKEMTDIQSRRIDNLLKCLNEFSASEEKWKEQHICEHPKDQRLLKPVSSDSLYHNVVCGRCGKVLERVLPARYVTLQLEIAEAVVARIKSRQPKKPQPKSGGKK